MFCKEGEERSKGRVDTEHRYMKGKGNDGERDEMIGQGRVWGFGQLL